MSSNNDNNSISWCLLQIVQFSNPAYRATLLYLKGVGGKTRSLFLSKRYIFCQDLTLFCALVWTNHGQAWAFLWATFNYKQLPEVICMSANCRGL